MKDIKKSDSDPSTPIPNTQSNESPGPYLSGSNSVPFMQDMGLPFNAGGSNEQNGLNGLEDERQSGLWDFNTDGIGGDQSGLAFLNGGQFNPNTLTAGQNFNAFSNDGSIPALNLLSNALNNHAQQTVQQNDQQSSPTVNQSPSLLSTSRPTGSLIPTHVSKNHPFLNKLRSMVDDPNTNDLIHWSDDGETFLVPDNVRFGDEVLPRFFKHNRFSSFVRQLNMYGFHKVPHLQQGALKTEPAQGVELWEFRNENFKRDKPELVLKMHRKKGVRIEDEGKEGSSSTGGKGQDSDNNGSAPLDAINGALMRSQRGEGETSLMQLAPIWSAIAALQQSQQGINDNLRHLHSNNSELWREVAEQRARSKKQEETINKMLRFLAGVFGAQDTNNIRQSSHRSEDSPQPGGTGTGRGNVGMRTYDGERRRLLIRDASPRGGQIEELEVPESEEDDSTPRARIVEERSGTNSPNMNTSPPSRFINLPETPYSKASGGSDSKQTPLPFVSSETASTPGGGRRISQQAGAQLLSALASGEAQSWLANLFGNQQAGQSAQSNGTRNDNLNSAASGSGSFKLDAQTLAALQNIIAAGAVAGQNPDSVKQNAGGYFENSNQSNNQNLNTTANPNLSGWNAGGSAALSPRSQSVSDQSQLSRLVPQQQQQLQNVTQDATAVQNALNALVEGLRLEAAAQGNLPSNPAQSGNNNPSSGYTPGTSTDGVDSNGLANGEVDMDSLLKEFFNENGSSGGDIGSGQTPAFAFSPAGDKGSDAEQTTASHSEATSAADSPTNGITHINKNSSSRKRKNVDDESMEDVQTSTRTHGGKTKSTKQATSSGKK